MTFFDGDDDFGDDDEDEYSCNSVNFQARTSRFCMEIHLDNSYDDDNDVNWRSKILLTWWKDDADGALDPWSCYFIFPLKLRKTRKNDDFVWKLVVIDENDTF